MQIFQWIFKVAQEHQDRETTTTDKEMVDTVKKKAESRDLVLFKRSDLCRRSKGFKEDELELKDSDSITILVGRGNAKTCFYSTLNLKRLESFPKVQNWLHSLRLKDEDIAREPLMGHNVDLPAHVGKKVLPLCDVPTSASTTTNDQCGSLEKKGKPKGNKTRPISRMKELLRWAATNKSKKGGKYMGQKVLYFHDRGALKATPHDDELRNSSSKSSVRWEVGNHSTSSSAYSGSSRNEWARSKPTSNNPETSDCNDKETTLASQDGERRPSRRGNWITTDENFVVLEL